MRETLDLLPELKYIGVLATGYNVVDMEAAARRNIVVTNVPSYSTMSVMQTAFAHLLNLAMHVAEHGRGVAAGAGRVRRIFAIGTIRWLNWTA